MANQTLPILLDAARSGSAVEVLRAGAAALEQGLQGEALAPVIAAIERFPDEPRLWQLLGLLNRDLEDLAAAVAAFDKAASLSPGDADILHGLACVRFEAGLPAVADFERAREVIRGAQSAIGFAEVNGATDVVKVSVIGVGMRSHAGVAAMMFRALAERGINIQAITTSEIKISILIEAAYTELAVRTLHSVYGLDKA